MTQEELVEILDSNPDLIICDGFDEAILGTAERINLGPVLAYSIEKIIEILMTRDNMSYEDAMEYFNYNILGSWVGEFTPVYITN